MKTDGFCEAFASGFCHGTYDEVQAVECAPKHECPCCSVPQSAYKEGDEEVVVPTPFDGAAAA